MENHLSAENQRLIENQQDGHYDFEHPEISVDQLANIEDRNSQKKMRVVLKYPDGSLSHGKQYFQYFLKITTEQIQQSNL